MKKLLKIFNIKNATKVFGILLGAVALYFSFKNVSGKEFLAALESMRTFWIFPIIVINFLVIACKAYRWQVMLKPIKKLGLWFMYKIIMIGFMANNVLPARLGEPLRIYLLSRGADVSKVSTAGTLVADRIVEGISFLLMAALLVLFANVPEWMRSGILITLGIIVILCIAATIFLKRDFKNSHFKNFQAGIVALKDPKLLFVGLLSSLLSWFLQGAMFYMTQIAFGVEIPVWGIFIVLITVNLAVALPSAPAYVGTFEYACVLAYTFMGVDKSVALLIGITNHLLQVIPVTLAGGLFAFFLSQSSKAQAPRKAYQ